MNMADRRQVLVREKRQAEREDAENRLEAAREKFEVAEREMTVANLNVSKAPKDDLFYDVSTDAARKAMAYVQALSELRKKETAAIAVGIRVIRQTAVKNPQKV